MKKKFNFVIYILGMFLLFQVYIFTGFAQRIDSLNLKTLKLTKKQIETYAKDKSIELQIKRKEAEDYAKRNKLPIRKVFKEGKVIELQRMEKGQPIYYQTLNIDAAGTISTDDVWGDPYYLTGNSVTMGIWDGGGVRLTHQELINRVTQIDNPSSVSDHTTHVAGTMISFGNIYNSHGMSPAAYLEAYDWNEDISEITNSNFSINTSNHSYGPICGWLWDGLVWRWFGDPSISETEDYKFGFYDNVSKDIDNITYSIRPFHLIVAAAGNDRTDDGPGLNGFHYLGWTTNSSTTTRDPDGGTDGYDCILPGIQTAKNTLTVGAILDYQYILTDFSSWGPTDDGRIKPDVAANGDELYSTVAFVPGSWPPVVSDDSYDYMSGTSMASPSVSGSIGLLLEYIHNEFPFRPILASELKALIINTADEAGNWQGPDYAFGWGVMNTKKAADVIQLETVDGEKTHICSYVLQQNETKDFVIDYDGTEDLIVTICWSDPPGTPPAPQLNPTTKMLVNDLDLRVISQSKDGFVYSPWVLNPASPTTPATTGDNTRDNVEKVEVATTTAGQYIARITHKGTLQGLEQQFSIIVNGGRMQPPQPPPNTVNITIYQHTDFGEDFDFIKAWDEQGSWLGAYPSPSVIPDYPKNTEIKLRATDRIHPNGSEKFNHWSMNGSDYNRHIYHIRNSGTTNKTISSHLRYTKDAHLKQYLISANAEAQEEVLFKDPWLKDIDMGQYGMNNQAGNALYKPYTAPLPITRNSDFKGVFLDETTVKYGVGSPIELTILFHGESFQWFFDKWTSNDAYFSDPNNHNDDYYLTQLVFTNGNPTVYANYKGKLAANTENMLKANGGRKVWNFGGWDPENNPSHENIPGHFMVYEDNGDIYYTEYRYIDVVTPTYYWTDEILLSDGSGNSKFPSMAIAFMDEFVGIVWQQYDPSSGHYRIILRQKDYDYTGWENPVEVTSSSTSSQSKPVIGVLNWYMGGPTYHDWFIVWDNGDVLKFSQIDTWGNVVHTIDVPETDNSLCHNPTITPTYYFGTIAWENSSEIWALDFEFSPYGSYFIDNPLNVSEGFYLMDCHSPSLTNSVYGDNAMLTWYGRRKNFDSPESESIPTPYIDPEKQYRILARKKDDSGEWGGLKVISYDDGHHNLNPSIGAANNDDFSLLWKVDNSDLVARLDYIEGQGWNYNSQIVTYDDDNINDPSASCGSGDLTAVWSKYREAPFRIVHQTLDPPTESGFKENTSTDYKLFREAKINLSLLNAHLNGNISLIFSEFQNFDNNEKILFSPDSTEKMNFMGSSLFQPDSSLQRIKFNIWIWGYDLKFNPNIENFEKDIFRVHLKRMVRNNSNSDGQILKLIKSFKLSDIIIHPNGSFLIEDQVVLDLSKYHNDILMIDTEFLSNFITNQSLSFIETFLAKDQISKFDIFSENLNKIKESDNQTVPSKFNLYPAYPNPFNPTTNIKYDLSGDSQVTLEIFDITGRRIRTLIKDFKSAGSYNAMWDGLDDLGNSVSSGLYVYRLQINIIPTKANNPDVKNKFVQIRKMLLIK